MRINRALDAATKQAWLNWTDEEGRTALMWACQKNHLHVAQLVSRCTHMRDNRTNCWWSARAGRHMTKACLIWGLQLLRIVSAQQFV